MKKYFTILLCVLVFFIIWRMAMSLTLSSSAFKDGEKIPKQYSCNGSNISPPLEWKNIPPEAKSFVLIMDDPDAPAGTWVHWILVNIPPGVKSLSENLTIPPEGAAFARNSWNRNDYSGPCPPSGTHRYYFTLYALDQLLPFNKRMNKAEIEKIIKGHVIESAELMGKFSSEIE